MKIRSMDRKYSMRGLKRGIEYFNSLNMTPSLLLASQNIVESIEHDRDRQSDDNIYYDIMSWQDTLIQEYQYGRMMVEKMNFPLKQTKKFMYLQPSKIGLNSKQTFIDRKRNILYQNKFQLTIYGLNDDYIPIIFHNINSTLFYISCQFGPHRLDQYWPFNTMIKIS